MTDTLAVPSVSVGRVQRELASYCLRLTRWPVLLAGVAGSWLVVWWRAGDVTTADGAVWLVRSVVALGAVTVVFALDDPSIDMTRALPATRRAVMRVRFAVGGVALVVSVVPAVLTSWAYLDTSSTLAGVALEVCVLPALTLSAALVMQRQFGISEPAQFVILVVLGLMMAAQLLGQRWPLLVPPGPEWAEAHWRWAALLLIAGLVGGWQLRDPASRPLKRFLLR